MYENLRNHAVTAHAPVDRLEFLLTRYDVPTSNIPLGEWKTLVAVQKKAIDQNIIAEYALDFALASRSGEGRGIISNKHLVTKIYDQLSKHNKSRALVVFYF